MKLFWPHRSKAKGFLIQNLAFKNRKKITSLSTGKISDQLSTDRNLKSQIEVGKHLEISSLLKERGHWANRDFSEYREVS